MGTDKTLETTDLDDETGPLEVKDKVASYVALSDLLDAQNDDHISQVFETTEAQTDVTEAEDTEVSVTTEIVVDVSTKISVIPTELPLKVVLSQLYDEAASSGDEANLGEPMYEVDEAPTAEYIEEVIAQSVVDAVEEVIEDVVQDHDSDADGVVVDEIEVIHANVETTEESLGEEVSTENVSEEDRLAQESIKEEILDSVKVAVEDAIKDAEATKDEEEVEEIKTN